ncbi:MAG: DUF975 family protein, partial [Romboutsia sp.]|uniref:DUF975 family protein n=1 Tax=Romboutsia sp. TaxID=1965302 RepID=UPI003F3358A6
SRSELKSSAKSQLAGHWGLAIGVCLVYTIIIQATTASTGSSATGNSDTFMITLNILGWILYGPILVGFSRFTLNLAKKDNSAKFTDLFSGFKLFLKSLVITIIINLCVVVGTILFVIPGIIVGLMFSQAYFILAENPEMSAIDCLSESVSMMKGNKWSLFVLGISFIGWMIACVFTFGIGLLWYTPYYEMTMTNFYLNLKETKI